MVIAHTTATRYFPGHRKVSCEGDLLRETPAADSNSAPGSIYVWGQHQAASEVLCRWRVSSQASTSDQRYLTERPRAYQRGECGSPSIRRLAQVISLVLVRCANCLVLIRSSFIKTSSISRDYSLDFCRLDDDRSVAQICFRATDASGF